MEEKETKTVQMDNKGKNNEAPKKVSYEDLQKAAGQLYQQSQALMHENEQLKEQIQKLNGVEIRLHYLFEVLDKGNYFDDDFIEKIVNEIKEIMIIDNTEEEGQEAKES